MRQTLWHHAYEQGGGGTKLDESRIRATSGQGNEDTTLPDKGKEVQGGERVTKTDITVGDVREIKEASMNHWYENFWIGFGIMIFLASTGIGICTALIRSVPQ